MAKKSTPRKPVKTPAEKTGVLIRFSPSELQPLTQLLGHTHEPRESFCRRAILAAIPRHHTKGVKL